MSMIETAIYRDTKWLVENGYQYIDQHKFCDWVTREVNDGKSENDARQYVVDKMIEENI